MKPFVLSVRCQKVTWYAVVSTSYWLSVFQCYCEVTQLLIFWENAGAVGRLPCGARLFSGVRQKPYPVFVECLFNLFAQILLWLSFCFLLAFSCYK